MNIEITGSPIFTTLPILGGIPITATLVVTWGIMLLLTVFCIWLTHDLRVDNVTTRQTIAEFLVNTAQGFVDNNMGVRFSIMRRSSPPFSRCHCSPAYLVCWVCSLPRRIFPLSWAGRYWCSCLLPPPRSKPTASAVISRATLSPSRCSPHSISLARLRPPSRWRFVTLEISSRVPSSAPSSMRHSVLQAMHCSVCCPASWVISFRRSRSFRSVSPPCSRSILIGSPASCRRSSSVCSL